MVALVEKRMLDGSIWDAVKDGVSIVLGALVGYLIALIGKPSMTQVKGLTDPISERLVRLEAKTESYVTKAEFKEAILDLKVSRQQNHDETWSLMNDIKIEVRDIRRQYAAD